MTVLFVLFFDNLLVFCTLIDTRDTPANNQLFFYSSTQHEQQIDPTDIVLIPYNLTRLTLYVLTTVVVALLAVHSQKQQAVMVVLRQQLLPWTAMFWCIMILSGTNPTVHPLHNILGAMYSTTLCLLDPPFVTSADTGASIPPAAAAASQRQLTTLLGQRFAGSSSSQHNVVSRTMAQGTLAGAAALQILRLYDRGWQVQRWPVPLIVGSSVGWAVGLLVGTLVVEQQRRRRHRRRQRPSSAL